MQTHSTTSQLAILDSLSTAAESDAHKAWYILSILLSLGRPAPPLELACRCTFFHATPDLILYLCSIPDSPIFLTSSTDHHTLLVTISLLGLFYITRFASNSNLIDAFVPRIGSGARGCGMSFEDLIRIWFRKRKRIRFDPEDEDEKGRLVSLPLKRARDEPMKVRFLITEDIGRGINALPSYFGLIPDMAFKTIDGKFSHKLSNIRQIEDITKETAILDRKEFKQIQECEPHEESALPDRIVDEQCRPKDALVGEIDLNNRTDTEDAFCRVYVRKNSLSPLAFASTNNTCNATAGGCAETEGMGCSGELLTGASKMETKVENLSHLINTVTLNTQSPEGSSGCNMVNDMTTLIKEPIFPDGSNCRSIYALTSLPKEPLTTCANNRVFFPTTEHSVAQKQSPKSSAKMKANCQDTMTSRKEAPLQSLELGKAASSLKENQQSKRNHLEIHMEQKLKEKCENIHIREGRNDATTNSPMDKMEPTNLPNFESYIVEEEEGSGGYGIVYRARRKTDGTTVAIKCPHANAPRNHVSNEQRMLERFGGKNFIIKYEGRIKNGKSDCFVLEHVEHDRQEVLKREIDVFQLRLYGFCMFRALAGLHKQGVVHRDVKPGNFLFSRKANKGYLIDFNLAQDLHQKYGTNKFKVGSDATFTHLALPNAKSIPPTKSGRIPTAKSLQTSNQEAIKGLKSSLEAKNLKKKVVERGKINEGLGGLSITKSQGADGSGITSLKDVTSTRTPSAERMREPLPCHGRKELINLLHKAIQRPNQEASSVPASMRKRITATPGRVNGGLIYITPMPLHSTGIVVAGTGKDGKQKREGSCVGTKGFKAPEVLLRSIHQGPKIDVWSAGVTLLYMMIGKTPFYGDSEENIKEIAKLRGSEDLWEVSKLHNQESAFPLEMYNTQSFPSMSLLEWCKMNTKRRDFLDSIPSSLIDLVDKCLMVNPRLRISAEEALNHEFFAPCHELLRKQRLLRQKVSMESESVLPSPGQSISKDGQSASLC